MVGSDDRLAQGYLKVLGNPVLRIMDNWGTFTADGRLVQCYLKVWKNLVISVDHNLGTFLADGLRVTDN